MTDFNELGAPGTATHFEPISVSDAQGEWRRLLSERG